MQIDQTDSNLFYFIDYSESSTTSLRSVRAIRDACDHVVGWSGTSTFIATIPYGDANMVFGPNDTLLFSEWPRNTLGQLRFGDTQTTWTTPMTPLGVSSSGSGTAGLARVPYGYTTSGELRTMTWGGDFYALSTSTDAGTGKVTYDTATWQVRLPNGPGGMSYIPGGSPGLTGRQLVVLEYNTSSVSVYGTDQNAVPNGTRTRILSRASGAWGGGFADPISGDLYWAAWGGDNLMHVIVGFAKPECAADSDCHAGTYCSGVTHHCVAGLPNGASLPTDPNHPGGALDGTCTPGVAALVCTSGACNAVANTCAGPVQTACAADGECVSNTCGQNWHCGATDGTGSCTADNAAQQCQSGVCSVGGACMPAAPGACWVDADCDGSHYCDRGALTCTPKKASGETLPTDGLHDTCPGSGMDAACTSSHCNASTGTCADVNGSACSSAGACTSNVCDGDGHCGYADGSGPCTTPSAPVVCRSGACGDTGVCLPPGGCAADSDCDSGHYCDVGSLSCRAAEPNGTLVPSARGTCAQPIHAPSDVARACASGHCDAVTNTCAGVNTTTSCSTAAECESNVCGSDHHCGLPNGVGPCTADSAASVCRSGACAKNSASCAPATSGSCATDDDCASTSFCLLSTFSCTPKLPGDAPIPRGDAHVACAQGKSNACESGDCNAVTTTCASPTGSACTDASGCVTNVCAKNHVCGDLNGQGACTSTDATDCQSGVCGSDLACGALIGGSCAHDADCRSGSCDSTHGVCVDVAAPGAVTPSGVGPAPTPPAPANTVPPKSGTDDDTQLAGGGGCSSVPGLPANDLPVVPLALGVAGILMSRRRARGSR